MNKWILLTTLAVSVAACSKDKPAESPEGTMTPATEAGTTGRADVDAIRMTLIREYPQQADQIRALSISENNGVVTLSGTLHDEPNRNRIVSRVRQMPGVRDVEDRLRSQQGMAQTGQTGMQQQPMSSTADEVRMFMLQERPNDPDIVRGLVISEDGGIVTLRGRVYDEQMKSDLTRAARKARGVRDVKDDMQVDQSMKTGGGGGTTQMGGAGADSVRSTLLRERPNHSDVIKSLTITEHDDAIVLRGTVPDEKTKKQLMETAKKAAGKKSLRDELQVKKQ